MDVLAETVARLLERCSGLAVALTVIYSVVFLGVIIGIFVLVIKQFRDHMKKF